MITFKSDTELEIVDDFDSFNDIIKDRHNEVFKAGEPVDADIVSEGPEEFVDLQFGGGGGVAFGVQRACFDILP